MADVFVNPDSEKSESLAKRGFTFLEDGSWEIADKYFERALELSPENAEAYLGKLMVELKIPKKEVFKNYRESFDEMENYKYFIRFADDKLKEEIEGYNTFVKERKITEQKEKIYIRATAMMHSALTEEKLIKAAEVFESISGYKDADEMVDKCLQKAKTLVLEQEQKKAEAVIEKKKKKKRTILAVIVVFVLIIALGAGAIATVFIVPEVRYDKANELLENGEYMEAICAFNEMRSYEDSIEKIEQARRMLAKKETLSAGDTHVVALREDGTVVAVGQKNEGQCDVDDWSNIAVIEAGDYHTVGIKNDGTVVLTGYADYEQNVKNWTDIIAVAGANSHTLGLRSNGTVVSTRKYDNDNFDRNLFVESWTNVVAIATSHAHAVGLKADGTVFATGSNEFGECNVYGWTDIIAVEASYGYTAGLKKDGTVVLTTDKLYDSSLDVSDWTDIIAISAGNEHLVGLKSDGTVVATGSNNDDQCDVEDWTDIVAIDAGGHFTAGLRSDGTVVTTSDYINKKNDFSELKNIRTP